VNPLTDSWKPETQEIVIMFTFNPYAPENEESLTDNVVCTKCNTPNQPWREVTGNWWSYARSVTHTKGSSLSGPVDGTASRRTRARDNGAFGTEMDNHSARSRTRCKSGNKCKYAGRPCMSCPSAQRHSVLACPARSCVAGAVAPAHRGGGGGGE